MAATNSAIKKFPAHIPIFGTWIQAVLLLLLAIYTYFQTWEDLWPYWENKNATYTHGTLVALVALWLVWRVRSSADLITPRPSAAALPVVLLLSATWLLAARANVFIVYAMLWPMLAFAILWAGLGFQAALRFAFPLGFLYFAIPIWDYLKPVLQLTTSVVVGLLTQLFGVPAALDGSYVTLPTATIYIAEDCSGAHFLCVALAVGVLAGVLRGDNLRTRILILLIAGALSMAFNWLRILLIVLAYLHPGLKEGFETIGHITFGWWVFALDLVVFSLVLRFVPRSEEQVIAEPPKPGATSLSPGISSGLALAIVTALLLPAIAWTLPRFDYYPTELPDAGLRLSTSGFDVISPDLRWTPHFPGNVWEDRLAVGTGSGVALEIYANRYHEQSQGRELISRGSHIFDPMYFSPRSSSTVSLRGIANQQIPARRDIVVDGAGTSWISLYTYFVGNDAIASGRRVQLMTAVRSIYSRTTSGVLAVAMPCVDACESAMPAAHEMLVRAYQAYRDEFAE